jgi:hypothetical protein
MFAFSYRKQHKGAALTTEAAATAATVVVYCQKTSGWTSNMSESDIISILLTIKKS